MCDQWWGVSQMGEPRYWVLNGEQQQTKNK